MKSVLLCGNRRAEYKQKFEEFDKNKDGMVSVDEASICLKEILGFTEDKTKLLVHQYDYNNDGVLHYEEFVAFYMAVKQKSVIITTTRLLHFKLARRRCQQHETKSKAAGICGGTKTSYYL